MNYTDYYALQDKHKRELFDLLDWQDKYALEHLCKAVYKYSDPDEPEVRYNDWICFHTTQFWLGEAVDREYLIRICIDCGIFIYDYTDSFGRKFYEVNSAWRKFLIDEFDLNNEKGKDANI